jgi:hypothetical protein
MSSTHYYPYLSDGCPIFMFGRIDLDHADQGSPVLLGEAMLRVQKDDQPAMFVPHVRAFARLAERGSNAFMFGALREQPFDSLANERLLNLYATEQA